MPQQSGRTRRLLEGAAALLCVLLAGWSLACIQSGQQLTAQILATAAAGIPVGALLARVPGAVDRLFTRQPAADQAAVAAARGE